MLHEKGLFKLSKSSCINYSNCKYIVIIGCHLFSMWQFYYSWVWIDFMFHAFHLNLCLLYLDNKSYYILIQWCTQLYGAIS
jgi:hypothetical protein